MEDWITTAEAAKLSGYTLYHVRRLIAEGKVKAKKFGIFWIVSRRSLSAYVASQAKRGQRRGPKRKA